MLSDFEDLENFQELLHEIHLTLFEIPYLLQFLELVHACHSDERAMFICHLGSLLFPVSTLVDLH
jgi:hypothetical protein